MVFGLNISELVVGAIFGVIPAYWVHFWVLVTMLVCSFLWAWTGAGHGAIWRKGGCPVVALGAIFLVTHHWQVFLGLPTMIFALTLGYGIPTTQPPDKGSTLGRWWYKKTSCFTYEYIHQLMATIGTRGTIYLIVLASFIPAFF